MFNLKLTKILSTFEKTVNQLEQLIVKNSDEVVRNTDQIQHLQETNLDLIAESTQAKGVAEKIRDLISGED